MKKGGGNKRHADQKRRSKPVAIHRWQKGLNGKSHGLSKFHLTTSAPETHVIATRTSWKVDTFNLTHYKHF